MAEKSNINTDNKFYINTDTHYVGASAARMNSSRVVTTEQINRLPLDTLREVAKFHPLLIPPFTNDTLRRAVKDYVAGGERKRRIITKYGEISNWDTSRVTDMRNMFWDAGSFNQPLNNWDVSNVTDMTHMFLRATSFNQPLNKWEVSNVTNMSRMFQDATSFNQPLNKWNVSKVTNMSYMILNARSFNQPLHAPWYVV